MHSSVELGAIYATQYSVITSNVFPFAAAVVAVTLFGRIAPDDFGVFDKALITLFYVTGGDPWPEALPRVNEDGTANWVVAGFVMVFTIMVVWIILEVQESDRLSFSTS